MVILVGFVLVPSSPQQCRCCLGSMVNLVAMETSRGVPCFCCCSDEVKVQRFPVYARQAGTQGRLFNGRFC